MIGQNIDVFRDSSRFTIGPLHSSFQEESEFWSQKAFFTFRKSRMLNPLFYSQSNLTSKELKLEIITKFRSIQLHVTGTSKESLEISPPFLFPFFSVGEFEVSLEEGRAILTIGRGLDRAGHMFGKVIFEGNDYRYFYKFSKYRTSGLTRLFPDGLPACLSRKSIIVISYLAIWLNAYNADYRNS